MSLVIANAASQRRFSCSQTHLNISGWSLDCDAPTLPIWYRYSHPISSARLRNYALHNKSSPLPKYSICGLIGAIRYWLDGRLYAPDSVSASASYACANQVSETDSPTVRIALSDSGTWIAPCVFWWLYDNRPSTILSDVRFATSTNEIPPHK